MVGLDPRGRPEIVLLVALVWDPVLQALERIGHRRNVALILLAIISLENAVALVALLGSLISGHENSGGQLLLKGMTIWGTNVIAYGLWFWGFDRGGPVRRRQPDPPPPDFQFPQMENPQLAAPGWHPRLVDYIYVSFTNSIAFSPTDAMPLSRVGEAADALGVRRLGDQHPARDRPRREHLQVGNSPERPSSGKAAYSSSVWRLHHLLGLRCSTSRSFWADSFATPTGCASARWRT